MRMLRLDTLEPFQAVNLLSDPGAIPGPKVISNGCMVRLNWNLTDGKIGHNILYGQYTGTPALSAALAQTMFVAMTTGANWTTMAAFLASTCSLASVTLLDVRSTVGVEFNSTGAAVPGTSASPALPDETAVVFTMHTTTRGPGGRGRMYIPGWATNSLATGNVIAAAAVSAATAWVANAVGATITSNIGTWSLGLPARAAYTSPITGRQFPARNSGCLAITSGSVKDNHWDTQRKRGLK